MLLSYRPYAFVLGKVPDTDIYKNIDVYTAVSINLILNIYCYLAS